MPTSWPIRRRNGCRWSFSPVAEVGILRSKRDSLPQCQLPCHPIFSRSRCRTILSNLEKRRRRTNKSRVFVTHKRQVRVHPASIRCAEQTDASPQIAQVQDSSSAKRTDGQEHPRSAVDRHLLIGPSTAIGPFRYCTREARAEEEWTNERFDGSLLRCSSPPCE